MPGKIVHIEIPADDTGKSREFWGSLFGWEFQSFPGPSEYHMTRISDQSGAAITNMEPGKHGTRANAHSVKGEPMDRATALQTIRNARQTRGVSYEDLAKAIGTKDATYLAAALHGQHRLNADEAKKLAATVGVDVETAMVTTAMPLRTEFPLTTDPFKYRLMELVGVYGDALRDRCQELFGDGILSAIDCVVKLEKKGERGLITIDAKFLHYKEF